MTRKKIDIAAKKKHLNFVMLSEEEYSQLCAKLGPDGAADWIEELDLYLGSKGAKYESHYYTILTWARRKMKKDALKAGAAAPGSDAAADRLIEDLKRYRAMPSGFPADLADRFRRMCAKMKGGCMLPNPTRPALHGLLKSGAITNEQLKKEFLSVV